MNTLIITDQRVVKFETEYYTEAAFLYVLNRYKKAFGNITLFAKTGTRVTRSSVKINGVEIRESGSNADIYLGRNKKQISTIIKKYDLVVLRLPSVLGYQVAKIAKKNKIPYLTETMGCTWDQLWNHGIIGKCLAPFMFFKMKKTIRNADFASYVTSSFLQKRYPCKCAYLSASNVHIDANNPIVLNNRISKIKEMDVSSITLMTAGGVNVRYKGFQYVIGAIPLLNKKGIKVNYLIVGNGDNSYLKKVAKRKKVVDQVTFVGGVEHEQVLSLIDTADIYVQPSLQEGLPRTVIESMSRGCPSCGAKTAGIPELLNGQCVFKRKSKRAIANCILGMLRKETLILYSKETFEKSYEYSEPVLSKKRNKYYEMIKKHILNEGKE